MSDFFKGDSFALISCQSDAVFTEAKSEINDPGPFQRWQFLLSWSK
jgi:hypothetical protein